MCNLSAIENNKKSLRLVGNNKVNICVLVRLALRYLQAEKTTAQSSTFYFYRASKNKKSLPFPIARIV